MARRGKETDRPETDEEIIGALRRQVLQEAKKQQPKRAKRRKKQAAPADDEPPEVREFVRMTGRGKP